MYFFVSWLETNSFINKKLTEYKISRIFKFISITSYGIYLIHYNIYVMFSAKSQGFKELALAIITLIIASVINKFYEIPIMNLRDKINFEEKKSTIEDVKSIS